MAAGARSSSYRRFRNQSHSNEDTDVEAVLNPAQVGLYQLSHRVVMTPLTWVRSDSGDISSDREAALASAEPWLKPPVAISTCEKLVRKYRRRCEFKRV